VSDAARAPTPSAHAEPHRTHRVGWLRAAVLGANDGLISTSGLLVGVAAAAASPESILIAGIAGLVAGALSMAAGEYVSVSSQADAEEADLALERRELALNPRRERAELTAIYIARGLTPELAREVSGQLTAHDALGAHLRDEIGLTEVARARPVQAAIASALAFSAGAIPPVLAAWAVPPPSHTEIAIATSTLVLLVVLGGVAAWLGGAPVWRGAARVVFWGAVAMGCTALVGRLFGAAG
jgi:VIT1/CCC1 family predicted Fe2+/Mn2+ transporter